MAFANFEALCGGFCDIAGLPQPVLSPDDNGGVAFTVRMRGVDVTALEIACVRPDTAYLIAELGPLGDVGALQRCRAMLDANASGVLRRSVFSSNPETGAMLLQRAVSFASADITTVYEEVREMVDVGLQFREEPLPPRWPQCRLSRSREARAADVLENLGTPATRDELASLKQALEANFSLMTDEQGAAFARDAVTGALLKLCAGPLNPARGLREEQTAVLGSFDLRA